MKQASNIWSWMCENWPTVVLVLGAVLTIIGTVGSVVASNRDTDKTHSLLNKNQQLAIDNQTRTKRIEDLENMNAASNKIITDKETLIADLERENHTLLEEQKKNLAEHKKLIEEQMDRQSPFGSIK